MGYTKRQYIESAFEEIGLADYVFNLTAQELASAARRLDSMMAEWNARGLRLGFPIPASPQQTDLDTQTGVPDAANEAIITNLAIRLAPSFGKQTLPATMTTARRALSTLTAKYTNSAQMQYPSTTPAGAGNKQWNQFYSPFLKPPVDPLLAGKDGPIDYE